MASSTSGQRHATYFQSYDDRASLPGTAPLAAYLFRLMSTKRTNLCVSADVPTTRELLQLAEDVGDHICVFKTHADIVNDFGQKTTQGLQRLARKKGFLIFEDRKFGDIGSTVQRQYTSGPMQIVRWANIVNAHIFPGPAIISALSIAAEDAVTAYSSTVETSITGPRFDDDGECRESIEEPERPLLEKQQSNGAADYSMFDPSFVDHSTASPGSNPVPANFYPQQRKPSIVSVSTTISTKTENISNVANYHRRDLSSASNHPDDEAVVEPDTSTLLKELGHPPFARGLLLLAQMSTADNLMTPAYTAACVRHARDHRDFVVGFIGQSNLNVEPEDNFISMMPGINIESKGDGLGQTYDTPEKLIGDAGVDVAIVGRGIVNAPDRLQACLEYKTRAWNAYEARIRERQ